MNNFRPLNDHILVTKLKPITQSKGGIFLVDTENSKKDDISEGVVIKTGPGERLSDGSIRELDVKNGDRIYFQDYAGHEIELHGEKFLVFKEKYVQAVIEQ